MINTVFQSYESSYEKLVLDSAKKTGWLSKGIIYERNFRSLQSGILNDINTCFDHQILDALPK